MKLWTIAACVALAAVASTAQAEYPCGSCWGYGGAYQQYGMEHIPYFSLHPPVYYSYPVPRTYGYSPFAYPPGTMTPEVVAPAPATIINPHVPQEPKKVKPTGNTTAVAPKLIVNPYVSTTAE